MVISPSVFSLLCIHLHARQWFAACVVQTDPPVINEDRRTCDSFLSNSLLSNLLYTNISIHILHTVLYTFPKVLTRRICLIILTFLSWWSFPLFLWPWCLIWGWRCKEILNTCHSQRSKGQIDSLLSCYIIVAVFYIPMSYSTVKINPLPPWSD